LAKTEYANADIDARHSAKELPLVMGRKRKLPIVLRTQKKGELRETSQLVPGSNPSGSTTVRSWFGLEPIWV
jgi:hypothetical protein